MRDREQAIVASRMLWLNLNVNLQGSYGAIRKWVGRPDYGHGAASRALKISREPASAIEAGRSFHSFTVLKTNLGGDRIPRSINRLCDFLNMEFKTEQGG